MADVLIYGSYGYSGDLIAREAIDEGIEVILAGRNRAKILEQAKALDAESRVFGLDDQGVMEDALRDVEVVVHCAGPFIHTFEPMVEACLDTGTHYLDITGETAVFRSIASRDEAAREVGVMLLPGTAFDVVPTDCMAAYLQEQLPSAIELSLGFDIMDAWHLASGTIATAIENVPNDDAGVFLGNTIVRRDGEIVVRPPGWKSRRIDFGYQTKTALTIPWGDIVTAYHTTGIPNIEMYSGLNRPERVMVKSIQYIGWLYEFDSIRRTVSELVQRFKSGPSSTERDRDRSGVWGEARDDTGNVVEARLVCPGGYDIVEQAPVAIARRILDGDASAGFETPAGAYGPDLILDVDGVVREDLQ